VRCTAAGVEVSDTELFGIGDNDLAAVNLLGVEGIDCATVVQVRETLALDREGTGAARNCEPKQGEDTIRETRDGRAGGS